MILLIKESIPSPVKIDRKLVKDSKSNKKVVVSFLILFLFCTLERELKYFVHFKFSLQLGIGLLIIILILLLNRCVFTTSSPSDVITTPQGSRRLQHLLVFIVPIESNPS